MRIIILRVCTYYSKIVDEIYLDPDEDYTIKAKYLTDDYIRLVFPNE